jgi:hypothetical protein
MLFRRAVIFCKNPTDGLRTASSPLSGKEAGFSPKTAQKRWQISSFPAVPLLFSSGGEGAAAPLWAFRRIFKTRRKTRKKVPHGGILHLHFARGFAMIKALYCEKCDNTTIA